MSWRAASLGVTAACAALGLIGAQRGSHAVATAPSPLEARPAPSTVIEPTRPLFSTAPTVNPLAPLPGEVSRRVLALYDSSETVDDPDASPPRAVPVTTETARAHRLAELPLDHLGLVVDYRDVDREPLPTAEEMARYRGVLAWFGDNRLRRPDAYLRWLDEQLRAGRRVVAMEGLGATEDLQGRPASRELVDRVMARLGARSLGSESEDSSRISVVKADRAMVGFEAPLPEKLDYYDRFSAAPGSKVYLQIELTDEPDSASAVVWTSAAGGFALQTLVFREDRIGERWVTRWLIDPFRFFEAAFGVEGLPRVDFTTRNGQRIFYSQIDGDGMETLSELDYKSRCGEIVRDQILRRYDLPFTASVVVGSTAPAPVGKGNATEVQVARSIFALDNVEVASHGFAHPLNWRDARGADVSVPGLDGYALSGDWEIARSVEYIDRELAPPNKPCRAMLWTGDCNPTHDQLAVAYRLGLRNLNGGDPRMDAHFPSYAHLQPPVHRVGGLDQFFTSAANDYILTAEWTPPFYRFRNVLQTFERSGAPRRVVPVDVYFHYYSARNVSALTALREVLDWATKQPLAPMYASEYVDVVRDAEWARIARAGARAWTIRKGPSLRTVRFDEAVHVDVARSRGVLGYYFDPSVHATYVHLDGSAEALVQLAAAAPATPYLERASHAVDDAHLGDDAIELTTHGPGARTFVFAGLRPGQRWRFRGGDAIVDPRGRLTVTPPSEPGVTHLRIVRGDR